MSSPTEDEEEKIPSDFIHCVQKLLSSVSTLSKHLSILTAQKETTEQNEDLTHKLQVRIKKKDINLIIPRINRIYINLDIKKNIDFDHIFNYYRSLIKII